MSVTGLPAWFASCIIREIKRPPGRVPSGRQNNVGRPDASNTTAPTQFLKVSNETYAYRRFGAGPGLLLLFLQHFTGTLDNWDPAVTDPLASGREVILFESAHLGRPQARCLTRLPAWQSTHWHSWTVLVSNPAMFLASRWAAWLHNRWRRTARLFFAG
jgi:hypothetical protein